MSSKKTANIDEILNVDLTGCSKCQINSENFIGFHGLHKRYELYCQFFFLKMNTFTMKNGALKNPFNTLCS